MNKITVRATTPPDIAAKTFYDVNRQIPVYVPIEVVNEYTSDPLWQEFNIVGIEMPSGINTLPYTGKEGLGTRKLFCNGSVIIERNGSTYTAMGQSMR